MLVWSVALWLGAVGVGREVDVLWLGEMGLWSAVKSKPLQPLLLFSSKCLTSLPRGRSMSEKACAATVEESSEICKEKIRSGSSSVLKADSFLFCRHKGFAVVSEEAERQHH